MAEEEQDPLEQHRIPGIPDSMYYFPDFVTKDQEESILKSVRIHGNSIASDTDLAQVPNKWISLSHRRLQAIPARLTANNTLVSNTGLPEWLTKPISPGFDQLGIFRTSPHGGANHCLLNEYLPGQGIMPHEDGAAYHPVVATVSLGGMLVLDVYEKPSHDSRKGDGSETEGTYPRKAWRILQEPRSLLVTTGAAYTDTLHGIAEIKEDVDLNESTVANWSLLGAGKQAVEDAEGKNERSTRLSLTFRDVLKVSKLGSTIFGKQKG